MWVDALHQINHSRLPRFLVHGVMSLLSLISFQLGRCYVQGQPVHKITGIVGDAGESRGAWYKVWQSRASRAFGDIA